MSEPVYHGPLDCPTCGIKGYGTHTHEDCRAVCMSLAFDIAIGLVESVSKAWLTKQDAGTARFVNNDLKAEVCSIVREAVVSIVEISTDAIRSFAAKTAPKHEHFKPTTTEAA